MSQPNPERKSQKQENIVKDTTVSGDLTFAPQQIETYIETQIVEISAEKVTQKELNKSSPYKGLKRFNQSDREYFFGRDALIAKLFNAVNKSSFTLVLGASGSGKSSVVRAGLIPEFKKSLESQKLYDFIFTPNKDPFESLYRCLLSEEKDYRFSASDIEFVRQGKPNTLSELISELKKDKKRSLLFIDQFEQLFIDTDLEKRQNFVEGIVQVAEKRDSSVRIVLAMRSDFLEQFSFYPTLGALANQNNIHLVTEMYPDELRQAIEQPAAKHGVVFEPGLVEQIIKQVEGQSGYLPLLQHTIDLLWEKECTTKSSDGRLYIENRVLNKANYAALGGVRGSLQNYVDDIYKNICKENRDGELVTKQILLKLVNIVEYDSGSKAVSRRAYRYEFVGESVKKILQKFIDKNLLVSNYEYLSEEKSLSQDSVKHKQNATVEIAHEILLSSWDQLKRWLEEEKKAIIIKNWLADETRRWSKILAENKAKANDELLKGSRLGQIVEFQEENAFEKLGGLSQQEKKFIDASFEWRKREAKLAKRRVRWTIGGLTFGLITISIFAVTAIRQLHQSRINEINALSNSAEALLTSNQKLDALIAGLKAGKKIQNNLFGVNKETEIKLIARLQNIFYRVKQFNRLEGHEGSVEDMVFSPDGQVLSSASRDGTVKIWNMKGQLLHTLKGHNSFVNSLVFSPDGTTLASASRDGTVKIWNTKGQLLHTLKGHTDSVTIIKFSYDGQLIASTSDDRTVKLWNLQGQLLHTIKEKRYGVKSLVFSPNNQTIALTGGYRIVKLYDIEGKLLHTLEGHTESVNDLVFSPDGKVLASASRDETVKLWNLQGELLNTFRDDTDSDSIKNIVFSPDSQTLISTGLYGTAKLWSLEGDVLQTIKDGNSSLRHYTLSPNGQTLASASEDGEIKLWNLKGELLHTLEGHNSLINTVVFSPDGQTLASASEDGEIKLWNLKGELLSSFTYIIKQELVVPFTKVIFSPDEKTIATASRNGAVKLWNTKGQLLHTLIGHYDYVDNIIFSPDGQTLATSSRYYGVKLWNTKGQLLHSIEDKFVNSIVFSPDGQTLVSVGNQATVKLWNLKGELLHNLKGHVDYIEVSNVVFSPNSRVIASASEDGAIKLWNIKGELLHSLESHTISINSLVFSPDGKVLASASKDGTIKLWNTKGQLLNSLENYVNSINSLVFSPDGQIIASASDNRTIQLWNLDGQLLHSLESHTSSINSLVFSPDGKVLASASKDGTVKLWNTKGELIHTLEGHTGSIMNAAFSPNGKTLASASYDGTVKLWNLDLSDVLTRGCNWAQDHLTHNLNVSQEDHKLCNSTKSNNSYKFH